MSKVSNVLLKLFLLFALAFSLSACDPGLYDFIGDGGTGLDIRQFLDAKISYNQLLNDLEFMESKCYNDEGLASAQSLTIMLSYGLADMSKDASTFTDEQRSTKVQLYTEIRTVFLYANGNMGSGLNYFDAEIILNSTKEAIKYCKMVIAFL